MWRTPLGERALRGAEWTLFREVLGVLWDQVEMGIETDEPALFRTRVRAFDRLGPNQKLAMLALVGRALAREEVPPPELTSVSEGTVAAVLALLRQEVAIELDAAASPTDRRAAETEGIATHWRELVRAAYAEVEVLLAAQFENEQVEAEEEEEPTAALPPVTSTDKPTWESMTDELNDALLWDGDYDEEDPFLDAEPEERAADLAILRIDEDYFTGIAPDPTDAEVEEVRRVLAEICRGS